MIVTLSRYVFLSVVVAAGVVYHAVSTRQQFYRAAMYLSSSKVAVALLGNLAFALALFIHQLVIKLFLGSLRDIEQEMIRERLSSAVMETLLALTIFREEFSTYFVAMFASLVFIKVLHWLVQDRVDYVEVTPNITVFGHLRIVTFMSLLLALDAAFLQYTISGTIQANGQSVLLLFAFEYVILAATVVRYTLKYFMSMVDLAMDGNWTGKGTAVFYLELLADFVHLFVYGTFFAIVFMHYGLPLHLVRDLYSTFRNFRVRIADFLRFRQVTARLDRFPNATAEDLRRSDGVCIICREEMTEVGANKRLFCGHVFHVHCLRSWLERQQNCPTCRASVFRRPAAGQQQVQPAPAAQGVEPAEGAVAADGGDLAHRHADAGNDGADGAVVRPPVEPHPAAAAGGASLRHRRVGTANSAGASAGAAAATAPVTESAGPSSAGPSRSASQPITSVEAGAAGTSAVPLSTAAAPASGAAPPATGYAIAGGLPATEAAAAGVPEAGIGAGGSSAGMGAAAASNQAMLESARLALRSDQVRILQSIKTSLQMAQQRNAGSPNLLVNQPVAAAMAELGQIRARMFQVEMALAGALRSSRTADSESAAGSSAGMAGPLPHFPFTALPITSLGVASGSTTAGGSTAPASGSASGSGAGVANGGANPLAPFMLPFSPVAAPMPNVPGVIPGVPPVFGMPPPMMPIVPVALPLGTLASAAASNPGTVVAGVQVPLQHHQLAAAAAAAAASAAAAAMFGTGALPNVGGVFFVPQPLPPQTQQAQPTAAASDELASGAAGVTGGSADEAERPTTVPEAAAAGVSDSTSATTVGRDDAGVDILPEGKAEGVKDIAQEHQTCPGSSEALQSSAAELVVSAEPGPDGDAPTAVASPTDGEAGARGDEDPQEVMRRIRLQRFGQ
ncbi:hypothetical protein Vretimale_13122 [Volvox reticuliferus]|uniref:RING-type E3 ubiquitin transferase n=1 Tax=Volvox reticuliferus TaxID=1737510 RepID=A0A8J4FVK6_9CHLO|nr:hypothetical protein Vretifemale_15864 [Volvox reticuliferus]GIM09242.1 hypothetical protein Vretimale_13122 [Volvox reticuliferus]